MAKSKSKDQLTPELVRALVKAVRTNPNLTDAADACGVHPKSLQSWIARGLYPNPEPIYGALAQAARKSRALLRGKLYHRLYLAATDIDGDPKWAVYLLERMDEEGELTWQDTIPNASQMPAVRKHLWMNPSPEMLAEMASVGVKLVPVEPAPPQITEGELVDE